MKNIYKCALKDYLTDCLCKTRKSNKLTQAEFSEALMMDVRSYVCLEHGKNLCCTLTFIIFICFYCKDVDGHINDLRKILLAYKNSEHTPPC